MSQVFSLALYHLYVLKIKSTDGTISQAKFISKTLL